MTSVGMMASSVVVGGELLFNDPCDNFTLAPWTVGGTTSVIAGGKTGNGFNFPTGTAQTATYSIPTAKQTDMLTVGLWIKFGSVISSHDFLLLQSDAGATTHQRVSMSGISMTLSRGDGTGLVTSSGLTLATGTWYRVEASVRLSDTTGTATLRVDGTAWSTVGSVDTKNAGTKTVYDTIKLVGRSIINAWQTDDIYVRNDLVFGP